jgi:hypothetical protein
MKTIVLLAIAALLSGSAPLELTCKLQSKSPAGEWRFFRVYDASTGEVLLRQAVNGGDRKTIYSKHDQVRVESKLPGHTVYQPSTFAPCKGGNTIER